MEVTCMDEMECAQYTVMDCIDRSPKRGLFLRWRILDAEWWQRNSGIADELYDCELIQFKVGKIRGSRMLFDAVGGRKEIGGFVRLTRKGRMRLKHCDWLICEELKRAE